ncbi:MAG: hypothetical protein JXR96_26955 [Deltaproteobacteria bacterium]|nr:hypothetical protein [Deltaproteobacteria bacterium]
MTTGVLKVHSDLGAKGWHLVDMPEGSKPRGGVGLYQRGDEQAWLVHLEGRFEMQPAGDPRGAPWEP